MTSRVDQRQTPHWVAAQSTERAIFFTLTGQLRKDMTSLADRVHS